MSILFNTNQPIPMNDVSVTSGNADGWVLVARDSSLNANQPKPDAKTPQRKRPAKR